MKAVQNAFSTLETEKALIVRRNAARQVTISASFSFSSKWLIPRLHKLESEQAELDLRVDATDRLVDFDSEPANLAIRYCTRPPEKLESLLLFVDQIFPVCSPRLLDAMSEPRDPAEIVDHTLLHDNMRDYTWRDWLGSVGLDKELSLRGHHFSHSGNAVDAAIAGQGIALGRLPLVADDLASGRLVRPFAFSSPSKYAYYAIWPERSATNPFVRTVVEWLASEARGTEQVLL
jgi:LysR family glycine cleavage system transcriptional activator